MKKILIIAVGVISVSILVFISLNLKTSANIPVAVDSLDTFDWTEQKKIWADYEDKVGPDKAYDDLKIAYKDKNPNVQHEAMHVLGSVLYDALGTDSVAKCDFSFSYGCYHSVMAQALSEQGLGIVPELDDRCQGAKDRIDLFSCQHGIGHGITAFIGYEIDDLIEALSLCDSLSNKEPVSGCKSGSFMEYNFRSIGVSHGLIGGMRTLDEKKYYFPCDSLSQEFKAGCFFAQAGWWDKVLNNDYKKIGSLCGGIKEADIKEWCFRGVGNIAVEFGGYDPEKIKKICLDMPDYYGIAECTINASWTLYNEPSARNKSFTVCESLKPDDKNKCASVLDD